MSVVTDTVREPPDALAVVEAFNFVITTLAGTRGPVLERIAAQGLLSLASLLHRLEGL